MGNHTTVIDETPDAIIPNLISLSEIDTLFGDLYLQRAKELLHKEMPFETYRGLLRMEGDLSSFPNKIQNAMMQGNWSAVRDMTAEMQSMKVSYEQYRGKLGVARSLYEKEEVAVDPFSPGMLTIAGKQNQDLSVLRDRGLALLAALAKADPGWKEFYSRRHSEFEAENPAKSQGSSAATERNSPERLMQEAQDALEKGNLNKLREVADALSEKGGIDTTTGLAKEIDLDSLAKSRRLVYEFSEPAIEAARSMGLAHFRTESHVKDFAFLAPFVWHPTFADIENERGRAVRLSTLPLPADTPEALRSRVEMFVLHPFINSAGVRFLPPLVEEDVLVEDFADPAAGSEMPSSPLLEALGLKRRNSLTRMQIEAALAEHGHRVVKEKLGLDPVQFRLVCIPCDLHLRIGKDRGWGAQEIWTHFDGYMLTPGGKVHALAGGDVRFGGIYDLVGISRSYETDRIIARFAVVQRRRMARLQV